MDLNAGMVKPKKLNNSKVCGGNIERLTKNPAKDMQIVFMLKKQMAKTIKVQLSSPFVREKFILAEQRAFYEPRVFYVHQS